MNVNSSDYSSVFLKNVFLDVSAFFAVLINFILTVLIVTKSPKSLGNYKYLMIYISIFELAYAIVSCSEKPEIFTKLSAFFILVNVKTSIFPLFMAPFLDLLFVGFYGLVISLLAIHFIYRYLTFSNGKLIKSFQNKKLILWLLFPILNGAIWMFVGGFVFKHNEDSNRFMRKYYPSVLKGTIDLEDLYYMGPFYYPEDSNEHEYISWRHFQGSVVLLSLIFLSFATMIYCGVNCYRKMKKLVNQTSLSEKYREIEAQLFYALVFQTIIPVFLMHIPATLIYGAIFLNCATETLGSILTMSIALYPAVNPLPTILIVKSYRQGLKDFMSSIRYRIQCNPIPTVNPNGGSRPNGMSMFTRSI